MFKARSEAKAVEVFSGIVRRTLSNSDRAMLTEMTGAKGSTSGTHSHPNDEIAYVGSGRIRAEVAGESRELGPGDSYCAPAGQGHAIEALEDCVLVLAYSPLREEYMD